MPIFVFIYSFKAYSMEFEYEFHVGICANLSSSSRIPAGAGAYIVKTKSSEYKSIGSVYHSDLRLNTISDMVVLEYDNGDEISNAPSTKYHSTIIIRCLTSNVYCSSSTKGYCLWHMSRNLSVSVNRPDDHLIFELYHKDVCDSLAVGQTSNPSYRASTGLSFGSWLLIIGGTLFLLYLGFGVTYKALMMGARGLELIPNRNFWVEWGNLVADGCEAVFRSPESRAKYAGRGLYDDEYQPGGASRPGPGPGARQPSLLRDVGPLEAPSGGSRDRSGYAPLSDATGAQRGARGAILTDESAAIDDQQILPM